MRNAGNNSRDVEQIAKILVETIDIDEEVTMPTKRRAIDVDSGCSERKT